MWLGPSRFIGQKALGWTGGSGEGGAVGKGLVLTAKAFASRFWALTALCAYLEGLAPGRDHSKDLPSARPDRQGGHPLARPNYGFKKRQKEIARKEKQEKKRLRALERSKSQSDETSPDTDEDQDSDQSGPLAPLE